MVDDHIAQGERHVTRQLEIIAWLRSRGHPTEMAEQLLAEFQSTLLIPRSTSITTAPPSASKIPSGADPADGSTSDPS